MEYCGSDDWRRYVQDEMLPRVLAAVDLGDDVLEVGPGFGVVTQVLRTRVERLTAVEIDEQLATDLRILLAGGNVEVIHADATRLPFENRRFSAAASFTMLHHVGSPDLQDCMFAEVARVLRPGGLFVAADSVHSEKLEAFHDGDNYTPLDPAGIPARLRVAGFADVEVRKEEFGWVAIARVPAVT